METANKNKLLVSVAIIIIVFSIAGYFFIKYERNLLRMQKYKDLEAIADMKVKEIVDWRNEQLNAVNGVCESNLFEKAVESWLNNRANLTLKKEIIDRILTTKRLYQFSEIFIASQEGEILISANPGLTTPDTATANSVKSAINNGVMVVEDINRNPANNTIHFDIIYPYTNLKSKSSVAVVFRTDPYHHLIPLLKRWPTYSRTGEVLLVRKEKDSIIFLNEFRDIQNSVLNSRIPLTRTEMPAVAAALGRTGIFEGKDYRGVEVLADLRWRPEFDWYFVTKVDQDEIFSELYYRTSITIFTAGLFLLTVLTIIGLIYFYYQKAFYKKLYLQEEEVRKAQGEFKATLYSIGDAVITTDVNGLVTHINPVAESLTGWDELSAKGKSIETIFRIVNEETGVIVENPVKKVIEKGIIVGLANHTELISKDGISTPIADSGAPITDSDGKLQGVVLVFRDQLEERKSRKELEESRDRFMSLYTNMNEGVALHEVIFDENHLPVNYRLIEVNPQYEKIIGVTNETISGRLATEAYGTETAPYLEEFGTVAISKERYQFETYFPPMNKYFEISVVPWSANGFATIFTDVTIRKQSEIELEKASERWKTTFNAILDPVALIDSDSNILQCNKAFELYAGEGTTGLIGHKCHHLVHHSHENFNDCPLIRSKMSGERESMEFYDLGKIYSVIIDPVKTKGKEPTEFVHIMRDITESKKFEEELREREEKLAVTLNSIGDGVISTDRDGKITIMNPVAEQMTGWKYSEASGLHLDEIFITVEANTKLRVENPVQRVISQGTIVGLANHTILIARDGTELQIADSAAPIRNKEGEIIGVILVFSDVTKEYETRKVLIESERALRNSQIVARLGSYDFNIQTDSWVCTEVMDGVLGLDSNYSKTSAGWLAVVHPDSQREMKEYLLNYVISQKQRFDKEYKIVRMNDKEERWVHGLGELTFDQNGNPSHMIGTIQDITERKLAEQIIARSQQEYHNLFQFSPTGYVLVSEDGNFLKCNSTFCKMLGYSETEMLGKSFNEVTHPEDRTISSEKMKSMLNQQLGTLIFEKRYLRKDSSVIIAEVSTQKIVEPQNSSSYFLTTVTDITERVKAKKELERFKDHLQELVNEKTKDLDKVNARLVGEIQKQKEYEMMLREALENEHELNELKTRFISTISHEFRTPLTSIYSSTELVERKAKNINEPKMSDYTERIKKSVDYLTKLLDDVIVINKAESGKLSFQPENINLREFCTEIIDDAKFLASQDHNFLFAFNAENENFLIDRKLMRFILSNLISNAHKYSPHGGNISMAIDFLEDHLLIKISDEGIGIPDQDKPRLFEPFYRSKNSNAIPGTGLGLSIVKKSVEMHSGEINFISEENMGTTFIVRIPQ